MAPCPVEQEDLPCAHGCCHPPELGQPDRGHGQRRMSRDRSRKHHPSKPYSEPTGSTECRTPRRPPGLERRVSRPATFAAAWTAAPLVGLALKQDPPAVIWRRDQPQHPLDPS